MAATGAHSYCTVAAHLLRNPHGVCWGTQVARSALTTIALCCRERQAFELQGYQGESDSAAYANGGDVGGGDSSILGGQYAPADRRRHACAAVLSTLAAVLLVAVIVIGGFGLFEVRSSGRMHCTSSDLKKEGCRAALHEKETFSD